MKIIVYPHDLGIGGSQLNAIELAAAVRDLGHDLVVFGRPGALNERIDDLGLEFVAAPEPGKRPSPTVARALRTLADARGADIIHGYEWPPVPGCGPCDARPRPGARGRDGDVHVGAVVHSPFYSAVRRHRGDRCRRTDGGTRRVGVIEPPVDLVFNDIDSDPGVADFVRRHGLTGDRITVVSVARFSRELKLEGTLAAIEAIGRMSRSVPVRLVLVGDGPARDEVERRAQEVNDQHGEGTIVLTGQVDDPRPAYAAADVALGMGGSALRALAYGRPLIVQGESGFWKTLTPETVDAFLWTGWYGVDGGAEYGVEALERELQPLVTDRVRRDELGRYGLGLVRDRFSLVHTAELQARQYAEAIAHPAALRGAAEASALMRYSGYYVGKRFRRARGVESTDDFNSRPVAGRNRESGR